MYIMYLNSRLLKNVILPVEFYNIQKHGNLVLWKMLISTKDRGGGEEGRECLALILQCQKTQIYTFGGLWGRGVKANDFVRNYSRYEETITKQTKI